jgi:phosphoribosylaminoimidazolecarboxamide formyltransferase/IMP cyclohydrolase
MIRAAAKNHADVAVVVEPDDYAAVLAELSQHGGATTLSLRTKLAAKAYARTAAYDAAIATWFDGELSAAKKPEERTSPRRFAVGGKLKQSLRYGENPHQSAAFYVTGEKRYGVATAEQIGGKELSYNNINDTTNASPAGHKTAAVAIIKHANPWGVATAPTPPKLRASAALRPGQRLRRHHRLQPHS